MITPLKVESLPQVDNIADANRLLEQVLTAQLPGYVVRHCWAGASEAVEGLRGTFTEKNFTTRDFEVTFGHYPPSASRERTIRLLGTFGGLAEGTKRNRRFISYTPLHADGLPGDHPTEVVNVHHTEAGRARVDLFEAADRLLEGHKVRQDASRIKRIISDFREVGQGGQLTEVFIPHITYSQLKMDQVDDNVLKPVRHTALLEAGSTLVFRSLGISPLYHRFRSIEVPRVSKVRIIELAKSD